jgi:predicted nuclease with TOPRIM domain
MDSKKQFSEEEMKKLKEIQEAYLEIQHNLGQIAVGKLRLEQQISKLDDLKVNLEKEFIKTQDVELVFVEEINKKYGEGVLNPDTGEFNPK